MERKYVVLERKDANGNLVSLYSDYFNAQVNGEALELNLDEYEKI